MIDTLEDLEACIGVAALPVKMKIIDHLDAEAARWLASSPLAFVAIGGPDGPQAAVAGGTAGFASAPAPAQLRIPRSAIDGLDQIHEGAGAGALFLAPGVGETLRVNGRIAGLSADAVEIAVDECFVHCAKALIRSDFWAADEAAPPSAPEAFLGAVRFLALASMDEEGRVDISPKGDPAGRLIRLIEGRAALAERPGNRLAFGYRNIITQPRIAALGLVPGASRVLKLSGRAQLTTEEALRAAFVVEDKAPILAMLIDDLNLDLVDSPALERAAPWAGEAPAPDIDPAAILMAHLKHNKARGVAATLLRLSVNRGLIASGLKTNYKTQLY